MNTKNKLVDLYASFKYYEFYNKDEFSKLLYVICILKIERIVENINNDRFKQKEDLL